jgi:hypothetical protein
MNFKVRWSVHYRMSSPTFVDHGPLTAWIFSGGVPEYKINILKILYGMRVKFSQQLHLNDF